VQGVHQEYGAGGYLGHYDSGQFNTYAFDPMGNSILTVGYSQITNATQYPCRVPPHKGQETHIPIWKIQLLKLSSVGMRTYL